MLINKETDKEQKPEPTPKKDEGLVDVAHMDVQCHIMIKDKDTGKVLLNERG